VDLLGFRTGLDVALTGNDPARKGQCSMTRMTIAGQTVDPIHSIPPYAVTDDKRALKKQIGAGPMAARP
jgi:hypothetical protein